MELLLQILNFSSEEKSNYKHVIHMNIVLYNIMYYKYIYIICMNIKSNYKS